MLEQYFDPEKNESYVPYVVETSIGLDRAVLSLLSGAYAEEKIAGEEGKEDLRKVLRLPATMAPIKVAVLPLVRKDGMPEYAQKIVDDLRWRMACYYEEKDTVGKRYRRQDAIGTPYCVTVDNQTLTDGTVTIRERDSMEQQRVDASRLAELLEPKVSLEGLLRSL